ncbi:twin-arginine translocation signal domain-containing protein [Shewanella baltica]|uniref:twin-arginine translocation signal domain-containing protein n=1 Tax=Shewanella baltica TaxID=62322 RepID=UPI0030D55136
MKQQPSDLSRRSLLKALTVGSVAIAATGMSVAQASESSKVTTKASKGYHETAHISSYYNSLRS